MAAQSAPVEALVVPEHLKGILDGILPVHETSDMKLVVRIRRWVTGACPFRVLMRLLPSPPSLPLPHIQGRTKPLFVLVQDHRGGHP